MRSQRPVTTLRKAGQLDEAYRLAAQQAAAPAADDWDIVDLAWCLIALIKQHAADADPATLQDYLGQLVRLQVPQDNRLLVEQRDRALASGDAAHRAVAAARRLGQEGRHVDAVHAFMRLAALGTLAPGDEVAYGWELFRANQEMLKAAGGSELLPGTVDTLKRHLNLYLKLRICEAGLLHSCMLQQAERLARGSHLRLVAFCRLWGLENLRAEDLQAVRHDDGRVFPSLMETVVQRASKEAVTDGSRAEQDFIRPYLTDAMQRFPENVWLKLNMVRLFRCLDRTDEARSLASDFARRKAGEYWTWELVGDLEDDAEVRLSCYAKALTCSDDDTFIAKVRLKFAAAIATAHPNQARAEVERVVEHRQRAGFRIPPEAERMMRAAWFASATAVPTGRGFYNRFTERAEELLFAHLPWLVATVGDAFTIKGQDGQKDRLRRRLYVAGTPLPWEIGVPATLAALRRLQAGAPVQVKMESSSTEAWKTTVHLIRPRPDGDDVVTELCGVIDHVNLAKGVVHFVLSKEIDGTVQLASLGGAATVGQAVAVRSVRYRDRSGIRTRTLSCAPTARPAPASVAKPFTEAVTLRGELGFTASGIFIPPSLVKAAQIADGDTVDGAAVISFDRKQERWGWKAVTACVTSTAPETEGL